MKEILVYGEIIMLQTGIVKKLNNSEAEVEITRSSACGESCASCGLCPGQTARVFAINDLGAKTGDTVVIDMADKKVLGAAFLVYIVPLIMLIAGYFISNAIFKSEALAILTGFIFLAVTFIVLIHLDRGLKRKYTPRIVEIKERAHDGV